MRLAVFQPDIAANLGAICRTAACFNLPVDVIMPCGFPFSEKAFRRSAMDYADHVSLQLHDDWSAFEETLSGRRLVLMTTKGAVRLDRFRFSEGDTILFGRESAGVPETLHKRADARVMIPLEQGMRSLNVSVCAGIAGWAATSQLSSQTITPASGSLP